MVKIIRVMLIATLLLCMSENVSAQQEGISLGQTRVIFPEGEKVQELTVYNRGKKSYLVQTRVYSDKELRQAAPFIATPPLSLLKGEGQQILRLLKQDGILPSGRESVYYLAVLAIPSHNNDENQDDGNAKVSMGFRFVVKLLYRPTNIAPVPNKDGCNLQITGNSEGYVISNPTPYYQTLGRLSVNNRDVNLNNITSMISPLDHQQYSFKERVHQVKWNIIDDYGGFSNVCEKKID